MGAEDGQHAHVLLRVVELVEAPQHPDAVVGEVHGPVAPVHRHDDHARSPPTAARRRSGAGRSTGADVRHTCTNASVSAVTSGTTSDRVHHREEEVVAVPAGEERPPLRRPHALDDEEHADDRQGHRTGHDHAQARDRAGEVGAAPAARPADPDQHRGGERRSRTRGGRRVPAPDRIRRVVRLPRSTTSSAGERSGATTPDDISDDPSWACGARTRRRRCRGSSLRHRSWTSPPSSRPWPTSPTCPTRCRGACRSRCPWPTSRGACRSR